MLPLLLLASARLSAETVVFDLDTVPLPTGSHSILSLPYTEGGLRLESNAANCVVIGTANSSYAGVKTFTPGTFGNLAQVTMTLSSPSGRFFSVRSATIHPLNSGQAVNIGFVGRRGFTSAQAATLSTGSNLAGTIGTFPAFFERIVSLEWNMNASGGAYQRFQFSRILIEFEGLLTTSSFTVLESQGVAQVPFTLDSPRTHDTTVNWEIFAQTATSASDFTFPGGSSTGTVVIPAGQTAAYVPVPIVNDSTNEGLETFLVRSWTTTPTVYLPNGNGNNDSIITIVSEDGAATFPGWMTAHGLSGPAADAAADPNGDGISNIES